MSSDTKVNLDAPIDLNSLFNLTYNFDLLKGVIEALVKAQKVTNQQMEDLEQKLDSKDTKIAEMNKEIQKLNVLIVNNIVSRQNLQKRNTITSYNDINSNADFKKDSEKEVITNVTNFNENNQEKVEIEEKNEYKYIYNSTTINNVTPNHKMENIDLLLIQDETINKLIKKINYLDFQLNNIFLLGDDVGVIKRKLKTHDDSLINHQRQIDDLRNHSYDMEFSINNFETQIQEINMKLLNLDLFDDLLKNKDGEQRNFSNDEINIILNNLEKKLNMKMVYVDERFKRNEDDILKLKQLEKSLEITKKKLEDTNKNINIHNEHILTIFARLEDLKNFTQNLNNLSKNEMEEKFNNLKILLEEKIFELNLSIQNIINNPNILTNNSTKETTGNNFDDNKIKDLQKKLGDLDKNFKLFTTTINIDILNKELAKLKEELDQKSSKEDLFELKDLYNKLLVQINFLKETLSQVVEDKKGLEEIQWLRKKIENLSSTILNMKINDETNSNQNNSSTFKQIPIDFSKYLEINVFNEFKNGSQKEFENIHSQITILRNLIDEILFQLKSIVSEKDLKNLEESLLAKIDELKSASNKKFADKNETAKNIKYLDSQIRQILEVYMKKMDKADNWLLAKKPLGGHSCASCESYIGDLHENNQYVPWNKYPNRDPSEKLYRIGNGFSKMLQMINIENNQKIKPTQTSHDFYKNAENDYSPRNVKEVVSLPRVKQNNLTKKGNMMMNMSADDVDINNIENYEEIMQPKVVKIYKKAKENKH